MDTVNQFLDRWKTEYDFRTFMSSVGSLAVALFFAFYNGFLGIYHQSLWYGTICIYYIILVLLRGWIIAAAKRLAQRNAGEKARNEVYLIAACMLLILNISLIVPVSMMVRQQKPVSMSLIPAIAMAAYTTYKIIMASFNLRKRRISSDSLVRLLRTINFVDALVSILILQNTLVMVNSGKNAMDMLPVTAFSSGVIWAGILVLSVTAIASGIMRIKNS